MAECHIKSTEGWEDDSLEKHLPYKPDTLHLDPQNSTEANTVHRVYKPRMSLCGDGRQRQGNTERFVNQLV